MKTHSTFYKKGRKRAEGRAKNHGQKLLGSSRNQFLSKNFSYLANRISKLLWTSDAVSSPFLLFWIGAYGAVILCLSRHCMLGMWVADNLSLFHRPTDWEGLYSRSLATPRPDLGEVLDFVEAFGGLGSEEVFWFCIRERHASLAAPMILAFYYSRLYVVAFHTALGLVWITSTIQRKC